MILAKMNIILWYCPNCDIQTRNWRKCPVCKGQAMHEEFKMTPLKRKEFTIVKDVTVEIGEKSIILRAGTRVNNYNDDPIWFYNYLCVPAGFELFPDEY